MIVRAGGEAHGMTAAIVGFLGVIIGAFMNGIVSARVEIARRHREARVGGRLVHAELQAIHRELDFIGSVDPPIGVDLQMLDPNLKMTDWDSHRAVLADMLSFEEFSTVTSTYLDAGAWLHTARQYPDARPDSRLLKESADGAAASLAVLERVARDPERRWWTAPGGRST